MKYLLAGLATLTMVGSASAADLAYRGARPPVMAPVYSPFYNWSGFYIGINGGGGWGSSTWDGIGGFSVSGGMIGVTGGYNYQINQFVLGAEADIDWSGINGSTNGCFFGCETRNSWLGTARGRLGYAFDRFMPYLTGGLAVGNISANTQLLPGGSTTNAGWTVGRRLRSRARRQRHRQSRVSLCRPRRFQLRPELRPAAELERLVLRQRAPRRHQRPLLSDRKLSHDFAQRCEAPTSPGLCRFAGGRILRLIRSAWWRRKPARCAAKSSSHSTSRGWSLRQPPSNRKSR